MQTAHATADCAATRGTRLGTRGDRNGLREVCVRCVSAAGGSGANADVCDHLRRVPAPNRGCGAGVSGTNRFISVPLLVYWCFYSYQVAAEPPVVVPPPNARAECSPMPGGGELHELGGVPVLAARIERERETARHRVWVCR